MGYDVGEECSFGCKNHVTHPCEKCGRYAAGLRNAPDPEIFIKKLWSSDNPVVYRVLSVSRELNWSESEVLTALCDILLRINEKQLQDAIEYRSGDVRPIAIQVNYNDLDNSTKNILGI